MRSIKKLLTLIIVLLYQCNIYAFTFNKEEPVYYFTNHDNEIASLREKLLISKIVGVTGITGITGMGKSEMVRQYVKEYSQDYDIIIFIDANLDLTSQFVMLAKEINKQICTKEDCYIAEDPKNVKQSLMTYLNTKDKWLLIFDNLHINENDKVKDIIEWSHKGHIIICSQDDKYLLQKVPAPYLEKEHAKIIINKIIKNSSSEFTEELIAILQDYPPYIISHSVIFLQNNPHISVPEYIDHMKKSENKLKTHLELVLSSLNKEAKDLLFDIALLNNQKVPRWLLNEVSSDKAKVTNIVSELTRFGLIEQTSSDRNNQVYRMHDSIKNELLENNKELSKKYIDTLLSKINELIPEVIYKRVEFIQRDSSLEGNIEVLLNNADLYGANIYKIMALRERMLWYYNIGVRQPNNAKKMVDWLDRNKKSIIVKDCKEKEKASYIQYLTFSGSYKYFGEKQNSKVSMKYFEEAEEIAKNLKGYEEEKTYIYTTKAQVNFTIGDTVEAMKNVKIAEKLRPATLKTFLGSGLVEFVKSNVFLLEGNYEEALKIILLSIEQSSFLSQDKANKTNSIGMFGEYITQATILNYMERYKEAYELINSNIYSHIKDKKKGQISSAVLARTLIELSRAELGMNKDKEALEHASEAVNLLKENDNNLDNSQNIFLAQALTAQGNAFAKTNKVIDAIVNYNHAKSIYWNVYGIKNIKNNNVSYLFAQGAKAACKLSNPEERNIKYNYFYGLLVKYFGINHPRTIEVKGLCS